MILVTGASRGIGWGICEALLDKDCQILGTYHSQDVETLPRFKNLYWRQLSLNSSNSVYNFIDEITNEGFVIDALVNNAGISQRKDILDISNENWHDVFEINFYGPIKLLVELTKLGHLRRAVNIISVSAMTGGVQQPHYAAAKAALLNFTKSFALLSAEHNVVINAVAPGLIKTDMLDSLNGSSSYDKLAHAITIKRIGEPSDIANLVAYLLINDPGYLNGQVITVNGGTHV